MPNSSIVETQRGVVIDAGLAWLSKLTPHDRVLLLERLRCNHMQELGDQDAFASLVQALKVLEYDLKYRERDDACLIR